MLIDRAERGDFQPLLALAYAGDSSETMSVGMQLSVLCSEDAPHISLEDVARETRGRTFGAYLVRDQLRACDVWPRAVIDPAYYDPVASTVPSLILSGDADPVTPPSWGEAVARHLPRSRHLVAPATGHGVAATACGARLIADFVEGGSPERLDAGCLLTIRRPPFFLTPSGPDPAPPVPLQDPGAGRVTGRTAAAPPAAGADRGSDRADTMLGASNGR
jgi:hypothetical protein